MSFLISNKSLSSIIVVFSVTCLYSSNAIIYEPLKYLVFHDRDTSIELSLL